MKKNSLLALWGIWFVVCAGLGFVTAEDTWVRVLLGALGFGFFLPPALVMYRAIRERDSETRKTLGLLAAASLGLTLALLILNILSVRWNAFWGGFLHTVLVILSAPMFCCGSWALSLFCWACLLILGLRKGE